MEEDEDEYESYRKRMMLAYRFRPNPLVRTCIYLLWKYISMLKLIYRTIQDDLIIENVNSKLYVIFIMCKDL